MRIPKRGEKGFTLIELLIVVAILGVLAAVVVPNVGRFLGRGEIEARKAEKHNIQAAVTAMMVDNNLATIPNPVGDAAASNLMNAYPDTISNVANLGKLKDPDGADYTDGTDTPGYLLYGHDRTAGAGTLVNYVSIKTSKYFYTAEADGTIHQFPATPAVTDDEFKD